MSEAMKTRGESLIEREMKTEEQRQDAVLLPGDQAVPSSHLMENGLEDFEAALIEIRSMWQLASILHFFHVFRKVIMFSLEFTAEELESALIQPENNPLLFHIHKTLLKGISPNSRVSLNENNWITLLSRKANSFWSSAEIGTSPIRPSHGEEVNVYYSLSPSQRVKLLYVICELRLEQEDIHIFVDSSIKSGVQATEFRLQCIFEKNKNVCFWFDDDTVLGFRLYKETKKPNVLSSPRSSRKMFLKGKKCPSDLSLSTWETVAASFIQFKQLEQSLESSRQKGDLKFLKILKYEILPELEEMERKRIIALKRKEKQAIMLSNQTNEIQRFFPTRSKRERKPVNYTFDEFDKSIIEAINSSKRKESNESPGSSSPFSKPPSKRNRSDGFSADEKWQSTRKNDEYLLNNPRTRSDHLRKTNLSLNENGKNSEQEVYLKEEDEEEIEIEPHQESIEVVEDNGVGSGRRNDDESDRDRIVDIEDDDDEFGDEDFPSKIEAVDDMKTNKSDEIAEDGNVKKRMGRKRKEKRSSPDDYSDKFSEEDEEVLEKEMNVKEANSYDKSDDDEEEDVIDENDETNYIKKTRDRKKEKISYTLPNDLEKKDVLTKMRSKRIIRLKTDYNKEVVLEYEESLNERTQEAANGFENENLKVEDDTEMNDAENAKIRNKDLSMDIDGMACNSDKVFNDDGCTAHDKEYNSDRKADHDRNEDSCRGRDAQDLDLPNQNLQPSLLKTCAQEGMGGTKSI